MIISSGASPLPEIIDVLKERAKWHSEGNKEKKQNPWRYGSECSKIKHMIFPDGKCTLSPDINLNL